MRLSRKLLVVVAFLVFGPRLVFFVWKVAKEQPLPQGQVDANSQNRIRQWAEAMWQRVSHGSRAGPPNPLGMNNTSPHTGSRGGRSHRGKSRAKVAAHGSPTAPASLRVLDYVRCNVSACGGTFAHQRQFVVFNATLQSATLRRWVRAPVRTSPIEASIWDQHGIGAIPNANQPAVTGATPASTGDTPNDGSSSIADQLYPVANIRVASAPREAAGGVGNVTAGSGEHIPQGQGPAVGPTRWRYFHFPKPLFDLLPIDEPRWHPRSCAVVGNSGAILLQTAGLEIDTHDVVIRLNLAPVYGFQPYVGQKTTFDFVNANNVRQLLQESTRVHLCRQLLESGGAARPLLLNPVFVTYVQAIWMELFRLLERRTFTSFNAKPMSGFYAIMAALQMCDKVHVYGFDAYSSKKISYRYHYFDDVKGFTDVHSFDMAFEIFKLMEGRGLVVMQHY